MRERSIVAEWRWGKSGEILLFCKLHKNTGRRPFNVAVMGEPTMGLTAAGSSQLAGPLVHVA